MTVYPLWLSLNELENIAAALPDNKKAAALRNYANLSEAAEQKLNEYQQLISDDEKIEIE